MVVQIFTLRLSGSDIINTSDIIQLNDWEPKKFLRFFATIQLLMLMFIGFDFMGLEIPIFRQVIGFFYLTFLPGIIILRVLKAHRLGITLTILLSTGLSISFLMFSGFFLNTILLLLNIDSPLSFWNVVIFITVTLTLLSIISYSTNPFYKYELKPLKISRTALYLLLLPVLSVVGTYFVNFHNNNTFLLILIFLIALIPLLVVFKKIPTELYPLAVFVIALSLLFHRSLISIYLTGWDIHIEYYFHKQVVENAYWNSRINSNVNGMLSIVILPAIYSYFLKMDGAWIFKIVYPVIYSLVPLGLYYVYRSQIKNDEKAFYSVFFFMSFFTFFTEMLSLARQEIAELFFVLLLLLMVQDTLNTNIRNFLLFVFGASLTTSHYGLSYIYILLLIIIYIFSIEMIRNLKIKGFSHPDFNLNKLTLNYFIIFYIIFTILWYISVSSSSAIWSIVYIGDHVYTSIFTEFFHPENRDRYVLIALGFADPIINSFGREVHRILQLITQFFIIIGFFKIIIYKESSKLKAEYLYLIIGSLIILMLSFLPYSAKSLNMTRIYHISLFALSPLVIVGGIFVIEKLIKKINIKNYLKQNHIVLIFVLGILVPYFLFNTGFVYEVTKDSPTSMSLDRDRMKNDNITKVDFYNTYMPEQDVYGARWFHQKKAENIRIYADGDARMHVLNSYGMTPRIEVDGLFKNGEIRNEDRINQNNYLYLRKFNVFENSYEIVNTSVILSLFKNSSKVYSNGCSEIYER